MGIPKYQVYKIIIYGKLTTINGYFGKQTELATEFVMRMFKEIYLMKKGKLEIKVG